MSAEQISVRILASANSRCDYVKSSSSAFRSQGGFPFRGRLLDHKITYRTGVTM